MRIQETVPSDPPPTEMEETSSLDDQLKAQKQNSIKNTKAERRVQKTTAKRVAQLPQRQNANGGALLIHSRGKPRTTTGSIFGTEIL